MTERFSKSMRDFHKTDKNESGECFTLWNMRDVLPVVMLVRLVAFTSTPILSSVKQMGIGTKQ